MTVTIDLEPLKAFAKYVEQLPEVARTSARLAINDTADLAVRKLLPDAMLTEIAFPPNYLKGTDKLSVASRATADNLVAAVVARARATSLARFSPGLTPGTPTPGGIRVQVKPGHTVLLPRAFAVKLKAGSASVRDDSYNVGLAVRLKPGKTLRNKTKLASVQLDDGVFILYGPSVDQVMQTVLNEKTGDDIADYAEAEFIRQFIRLSE